MGSRVVARLPQILERFKRSMNLKASQHAETSAFSFIMPGFKYDDFDRGGFVNLVKINKMMETDRTAHFRNLDFPNMDNMTFFIFGTRLQASKTLYKTAALDFPMKFHMQVSGIGRTSMDFSQLFIKEETDAILAQLAFRLVLVDPSTRTAVPIPEDVRLSLQQKLSKIPEYLRLPRFEVPISVTEKCFVHDLVVRNADLDFFFHSNQGSYLSYAFECATRAASEGFYSRICDDICFYPAKVASAIHVAESFAGDVLQVVTWEDSSDPMSIYFVIKCKDKDIYYAKVEFYDDQDFNGDDA